MPLAEVIICSGCAALEAIKRGIVELSMYIWDSIGQFWPSEEAGASYHIIVDLNVHRPSLGHVPYLTIVDKAWVLPRSSKIMPRVSRRRGD